MPHPAPLTSDGKKRLRQASKTAVSSYFQGLTDIQRNSAWLGSGNRYRVNCTSLYRHDLDNTCVQHPPLVAYIAASAPCHVIDGWSFLGRAVDATLRGDSYAAIHLAYYAELRAAMALLASEGIGIFNNRHATVDPRSRTHEFSKQNTHTIIWPCLRYWAGLAKAMRSVDSVFRPGNVGLAVWLGALGARTRARAIAYHWLRDWGVDLASYDKDHASRNMVSYRPSEFRLPTPANAHDISLFLDGIWSCFEPSEGNRFPVMEAYLLRRALIAGGVRFPLTEAALRAVGLSDTETAVWLSTLNNTTEPSLFAESRIQSDVEDSRCHLQVLSRATLLLYLATSIARGHIVNAGYARNDLAFWWREHGRRHGFWDDVGPQNPLDFWADIRELLRENNTFTTTEGQTLGLRALRNSESRVNEFIGGFEIVAIWGLLP